MTRQSQAVSVFQLLKRNSSYWVKSSYIRNMVWWTADRRASDLKTLWLAEIQDGVIINDEWKPIKVAEYRITKLWLQTSDEQMSKLLSKHNHRPKVKKTRAESEVKVDSKFINDELDKHYWIKKMQEWVKLYDHRFFNWPLREHTPPYKFSFVEWIKSLFR